MTQLKRLEIEGFKSFGKKTVLQFNTPITGVVGPNGSGKSNIVEAFRFVFGEQSMKSMRSDATADLLFQGAGQKATTAHVSITFDHIDIKNKNLLTDIASLIESPEIEIKRMITADKASQYFINGQLVRLKDITALSAALSLGIGSHHIISQGEADRMMSVSAKERKLMIEDSLGLRIYHIKIKETQKKLDQSQQNIKELTVKKNSLSPIFHDLKKQVEKIELSKKLADELSQTISAYYHISKTFLNEQTQTVSSQYGVLLSQISESEVTMTGLEDQAQKERDAISLYPQEGNELSNEIDHARESTRMIERDIDSLTLKIEFSQKEIEKIQRKMSQKKEVTYQFSESDFSVYKTVLGRIESALTLEDIKKIVESHEFKKAKELFASEQTLPDHSEFLSEIETLSGEVEVLQSHIAKKETELSQKKETIKQLQEKKQSDDRKNMEKFSALRTIESDISKLQKELFDLLSKKNSLEHTRMVLRTQLEDVELFHHRCLSYIEKETPIEEVSQHLKNLEPAALKQTCERLCFKIEDMGGGGSGDVVHLFEETKQEIDMITAHIEDTTGSIAELQAIITDLEQSLQAEFVEGLSKVNDMFGHNFSTLFSGGTASIVPTISDDEEGSNEGIEIEVVLPKKNITSLAMLSGGERALTSIALLFALCGVTPPPFLVLDETDAALDEANSQRFSTMLTDVSSRIPLVVITHNRETMSQSQKLFGVTIPKGGSSVVLSVVLEDALAYAK